jgi:hypothetical protein
MTARGAASTGEVSMARCDVCGNDYDKAFQVLSGRTTYTFDSFECAIHKLAPLCAHCGCRVIGHGVEAQGVIYCCANCARMTGTRAVVDRA